MSCHCSAYFLNHGHNEKAEAKRRMEGALDQMERAGTDGS